MIKKVILIGLFSSFLIGLAYFTPRQSFVQLFGLYSALFVVYFFLINTLKNAREIIFTGVFFRLLLLFSIPALSDDFYRFIWDGRLLFNGFNPYTILPSDFIQSADYQIVITDKTIFNKLNSPNYYTVYPPLNQFIFGISAALSQGNLFGNILLLRTFILLAEIGLLALMKQSNAIFNEDGREVALGLYAFNPLIILEFTGNLHFEGVMIFFFVMALFFALKNKKMTLEKLISSAFFFACAVCIKMLPIIFIPLIIKTLGLKKGVIYASLVGFFTLLFFIPFLDQTLIEKLFSSINLYFQKFEFNASIYYLLREMGFKIYGYNLIGFLGKLLAFITFSGIIFISWKKKDLFLAILLILTLYFSMATTVHPWYASSLVAISIFTRFRYPIIWSYVIFLSYATYQTELYQENLWLVVLEYLVVFGVMIHDFFSKNR
jgi:alpha-1,6-mannosyltransferase